MEHRILHVEDNPDDVMLVNMAFRRAGVGARFQVASDGCEAVRILDAMRPPLADCVLLDIKLPSLSGLEVLAWIRKHPTLKCMPVIMLSSSLLKSDINGAYELGANSYLTKPPSLEALVALARLIGQYWLNTNTPPMHSD